MKNLIIGILACILISCENNPQMIYPQTQKKPVIDVFFDHEVIDSYRWLEDGRTKETKDWVKAQKDMTFDYRDKIPCREQRKERLTELWNYQKIGTPFKEGKYTYFYKNDGLQNQYVIYRYADKIENAEVFLDPNSFSEEGTTSLAGLSFSKNSSLAAYSISEGGSDWRRVLVMNSETKEIIEDTINDLKFSRIQWKGNEGFYYSSYDKPEGSELSAKTDQHKLYFHKIKTPQSEDVVVFGGVESEKNRYVSAQVTEDDAYLIISASESTSGNKLFFKDLRKANTPLVLLTDSYENDHYLLDSEGDRLFIVTNFNAPNQKVVETNASKPEQMHWKDFIPETDYVLSPSSGSGFFFAEYMVDAISKIHQYDSKGINLGEVSLPGVGSVSGFSGEKEDTILYYRFTNYSNPSSIYTYSPLTQKSELYWNPSIDFDPSIYESKQVFYESKDSTKVPMIITYKKGVKLNGKNPTILYGYGGFNISLTPSFRIPNAVWMEQGGIYAVPNLRGGGEYGKAWHKAGTKLQKQNVFDDFIAAAEYLIAEKYTSSEYLAIKGGSNGGLLVGATMTQRPDLITVALPAVGVLDMLRYHTFTAGAGWAYDYGTAEDSEEMFNYLKGYSPVHNVKLGTSYPSTLITTGEHDDRVVPSHSFKFAAELQDNQQGKNPVMIRIETNAGHGAGTPVDKSINQYADIFGFTLYNMGYRVLPGKITDKIKG